MLQVCIIQIFILIMIQYYKIYSKLEDLNGTAIQAKLEKKDKISKIKTIDVKISRFGKIKTNNF